MGLEPTTTRLRVLRSTNWARREKGATGIEPATSGSAILRSTAELCTPGAIAAGQHDILEERTQQKKNDKYFLTQRNFWILFIVFIFFLEWHWWNQKFGCLQHAWHTPVPLHNSQSAMALLHGYPLGLFDHPSGPARYVISRRLAQRLTRTGSENGLRVRTKPPNADCAKKLFMKCFFFFFFNSFLF